LPVLGIIACRALEDELAHVLSEDRRLRHLIIIDNLDSLDLSRKLRSRNRSHLRAAWEDIPDMLQGFEKGAGLLKPLLGRSRLLCGLLGITDDAGEEIIIVANVLKIALHIDNKLLRAEVCKNIDEMSQFSDIILLFYGRCGNALQGIEVPLGRPLFFLTDGSGERVDDCIAAALGGNRQYAEALSSHQGVGYFCTPMWASSLGYTDGEAMKYAAEHHLKHKSLGDALTDLGYTKIALLDTGLKFISDCEVESRVNGFADSYHLEVIKLHGSVEIAERCYRQARDDAIPSAGKRKPATEGSGI
jgi:hypothetical protein